MSLLRKSDTGTWLELLARDHAVLVPAAGGSDVELADWSPGLNLAFKGRTHFPPKAEVFPESEVLLTFEVAGKGALETVSIREHGCGKRRLIWGVRPCDLRAIALLDAHFLAEPADFYYASRRRSTVLIALNCNEPGDPCFCNATGSGPFADGGFDLSMTDLGEDLLLEADSDTGASLLACARELLRRAGPEHRDKARELQSRAMQAFRTSVDATRVRERLARPANDAVFQDQAAKCKVCGTCSFVCPTCHCFNVEDLKRTSRRTERMRYWDSCQLNGFTQMAGHNSRPRQADRWRHKVLHKFLPGKLEGAWGCVGCGRCEDYCQADIKFAEVLRRLADG